MQTVERPCPTVAEAQAALDGLQARHDDRWNQLQAARREANRIRTGELAAAAKQRDQAIGAVVEAEGLIDDLLSRYATTRHELARLYLAVAALPLAVRPGGIWQSPVSLNELQTGDPSLANMIRDAVAALQTDADAPLPGAPSPLPEAA